MYFKMFTPKYQKFCAFLIALFTLITVHYVQSSDLVGRMSVSFVNGQYPFLDTSELEELIRVAVDLIEDTDISIDGNDISTSRYWATAEVHDIFQSAIDSSQAILSRLKTSESFNQHLAHGEYFHMTLQIEDNPGFATLEKRLFIPDGLELTHVHVLGLQEMLVAMPDGHLTETGEIEPIIGPGYAHIICMGVSDFTTRDSDLLVFTFKVTDSAALGETDAITLAFANVRGFSPPFNSNSNRVNISLPGNGSGKAGSVVIVAENIE